MRNFDPIDILFICLISCYLVVFIAILIILFFKYRKFKQKSILNKKPIIVEDFKDEINKKETTNKTKKNENNDTIKTKKNSKAINKNVTNSSKNKSNKKTNRKKSSSKKKSKSKKKTIKKKSARK